MRVYTTPTHTFYLPKNLNSSIIDIVKITYSENISKGKDWKKILVKNTEDCSISDNIISVKLTQEDTSLFTVGAEIRIQCHIKTTDGSVLRSKYAYTVCEDSDDKTIL